MRVTKRHLSFLYKKILQQKLQPRVSVWQQSWRQGALDAFCADYNQRVALGISSPSSHNTSSWCYVLLDISEKFSHDKIVPSFPQHSYKGKQTKKNIISQQQQKYRKTIKKNYVWIAKKSNFLPLALLLYTGFHHYFVEEVKGHACTVLVHSQSQLNAAQPSLLHTVLLTPPNSISKPQHLQFCTWNIWQDLLIRLNSAYSTSNSVRKISRNVYSFRSSCSCDSCYSAKPANKLEVLMRTNRGNLDTEKLTETAATRRGCVTPTTLPSAVQPASARYCQQIVWVRN